MSAKRSWLSRLFRPAGTGPRASFRPRCELLEDRCVPATFLVTTVGGVGPGSLRQAILNANANPGFDSIRFTTGVNGPIRLFSSLPAITDPVSIDGSVKFFNFRPLPNSSGRPLVEIDGSPAGDFAIAFTLEAGSDGSIIKGLVINRFDHEAFSIRSDNNTIQNCWIGLTFDGNGDAGNGDIGIRLLEGASNNLIGGAAASQRNVISGSPVGIDVGAGGMANTTIQGNFIGTNATGTAPIANNHGILLDDTSTNTQIVGNVISGNTFAGITLNGSSVTGTQIRGNKIGVAADSTTALGNTRFGVLVANGTHDNTIGGTAAGEGNLIAHNGEAGVHVGPIANSSSFGPGGNGNKILGNQIFNSLHTIFVTADGVNFPAQDALDADTGANDLQNFPDLISATKSSDNTNITVNGSLSSRVARIYRIEVFAFDNDRVVNGVIQDMIFVGVTFVATNSSGVGNFSAVLATPTALPLNARILATATDFTTGDTSNNSVNIAATSFPMIKNDVLTPEIKEGGLATLSGQLVDPDPTDFLTLTVNWGDGSPVQKYHPGTAPFAVTHKYLDDGLYDVTFSWFADNGPAKSRTRQVRVLNVAPEFTDVALRPLVPRLGLFMLSGNLVDPGTRDRLTLNINWGDGTSDQVTFSRQHPFVLVHRYRQSGSFVVTLTAADGDGGTVLKEVPVEVNFSVGW